MLWMQTNVASSGLREAFTPRPDELTGVNLETKWVYHLAYICNKPPPRLMTWDTKHVLWASWAILGWVAWLGLVGPWWPHSYVQLLEGWVGGRTIHWDSWSLLHMVTHPPGGSSELSYCGLREQQERTKSSTQVLLNLSCGQSKSSNKFRFKGWGKHGH